VTRQRAAFGTNPADLTGSPSCLVPIPQRSTGLRGVFDGLQRILTRSLNSDAKIGCGFGVHSVSQKLLKVSWAFNSPKTAYFQRIVQIITKIVDDSLRPDNN
jgi:hypothetical protein